MPMSILERLIAEAKVERFAGWVQLFPVMKNSQTRPRDAEQKLMQSVPRP